MNCTHEHFIAEAEVGRIPDGPSGIEFMISVKVNCRDCGTPFEWQGLPVGLSRSQPTMSFSRLELRAPIIPAGKPREKPIYTEHIAGDAYEGLQCCILCGEILSNLRSALVAPGSPQPQGFAPGTVWITSGNPRISTTIDPREDGCKVIPCTQKK